MIRHGENGFIYETGDAAELSDMISQIANDKDLYDKMSDAAYRRFAEELNSRKMTEETMALYRRLFSEHERAASAEV